MVFHRVLIFVVVLVLDACAAVPDGPSHNAVLIAPGLELVMPRPGDLGRKLEATQLVTARYGDRAMIFEGHISATPERFLLVVVDPLGRKAMTVTWTDDGVTYEAAPWLPATVRPQNMLADIVLLYWPEAVVRQALLASGGTLAASGQMRSISVAGQEVIHADYQPAGDGQAWAGHLHYRNLPWGYEMDISSVVLAS
jgi:hypothetical protein